MYGFGLLTRRERAVLRQLCVGDTPAEIADHDRVSLNTVRTQIRAIHTKIGVSTMSGAVGLAYRTGWMPVTVAA